MGTLLACVVLLGDVGWADGEVGYLYVESDPPNAQLIIDGNHEQLFQTPALCTLSVGEHQLTLSTEFYQPNTVKVIIAPRQVLRKKVRLIASLEVERQPDSGMGFYNVPGDLTILTDIFGVTVFLDGVRVTMTAPLTLPLVPSGIHTVRVEHNDLSFDTIVTVTPAVTTLLELHLLELWGLDTSQSQPDPVSVLVEIELPACHYHRLQPIENSSPFDSTQTYEGDVSKKELYAMSRRYDVPIWDDTSVGMRGVDPIIRILTSDTVIVISHRRAVELGFARLPQAHDLDVEMRAMTVSRVLSCPRGQGVRFEIELFANQSNKFTTFDRLVPIFKQFRLLTDLNDGGEINVRIVIDVDGEVHFRYW